MILLLTTGLRQLKNFMLAHKARVLIVVFAVLMVLVSLVVTSNAPIEQQLVLDINLDLYACAVVISVLFLLLSFAQADYMQISSSEANIFFVSPIKEHKILLYIFLKSSYQIFILIFAFAQLNITMVRPLFGLRGTQLLWLFLWEILLFCTNSMFGLFLAIVKKKNPLLFNGLMLLSIGSAVAAAAFFLLRLPASHDIVGDFNHFFSSPYWTFVPIAGVLARSAGMILNPGATSTVFFLITIGLNILFILSPYYIKVAMGEAAIEAARKNEVRREKKRAQSTGGGFKIEKKTKGSANVHFQGPWSIISKQWIDYKRSSRFFLSGNVLMILFIMVIYVVMFQFLDRSMGSDPGSEELTLVKTIISFRLLGVTVLISLMVSSVLPKDISNPSIILMPAKPYQKVLALSFIANFENAIKAVLVFGYQTLTGISPLLASMVSILYFLLISTATFIDLFIYAVIGKYELGLIQTIATSFMKTIVLLIYGGVYIAVFFIFNNGPLTFVSLPGVLVVLVVALIVDAGLVFLSDGLVEKGN